MMLMKKSYFLLLLPVLFMLQFCSSTKKTASSGKTEMKKVTFENDVKPLVMAKCGPCHTVGKKSHIGEFAIATAEIDDIIKRIEMNPGEHGFMPLKNEKLSDSAIAVFVQWKASGLLEK